MKDKRRKERDRERIARGLCTRCSQPAQGFRLCRDCAPYTRSVDVEAGAAWRMAVLHDVPMVAK